MAVPSEAANAIGMSSLDGGISFSREMFNMIGSIMAVSAT
jgi:hypothetical protein